MALRVTKAAVELEHFGPSLGQHQAGVQHAAIDNAFPLQGIQDGHQDVTFHGGHLFFIQDRRRAIRPHATGVWSRVAFPDPFVVLGGIKNPARIAIGEGQDGNLGPGEHFFDQQRVAGVTELAVHHDAGDGLFRLGQRAANHDAFSCRQSRRFDHAGFVFGADVFQRILRDREHSSIGGGDICRTHQLFGEGFVGLELSAVCSRSEDQSCFAGEGIVNAIGQRDFGSNHNQLNVVFVAPVSKLKEIVRLLVERAGG